MKTYYMTQLFADEAATETTAAETEQTAPAADQGGQAEQDAPAVNPRDVAKYSDNDLDKIVKDKVARERKKAAEAARLAEMNAQERAEAERDAYKAELDELKRTVNAAEMAKTARSMLSDNGVQVNDSLVSVLVTDDAETTKANVEQFASAFKAAVDDEVKKRLSGQVPKVGTGGAAASMTKDDILAVTDKAERQKLIAEHIDLFY